MPITIEPTRSVLAVEDVTRRDFLVGSAGLLALGVSGCGGNGSGEAASARIRTVEHAMGASEVPVRRGGWWRCTTSLSSTRSCSAASSL